MGITATDLHVLDPALKKLVVASSAPVHIACLGYPDVVIASAHYERFFAGRDWRGQLCRRDNWEKLLAIHGGSAQSIETVPTIDSFFSLYGDVKVTVIDIAQYVGNEVMHDMSQPIPDTLAGRFDMVIDAGTTEHVFDIACALFNCARMVKVGGCVYHAVPLHALNHGFYNISPTLLFDFYDDNGFKTIGCLGSGWGASANPEFFTIPPFDRFRIGGEAMLIYLAQKLKQVEPLVKPVQRKYRNIDNWR